MTKNEKIEVLFGGGECRDAFMGACNYMIATTTNDDGDEVELYEEVPVNGTPYEDIETLDEGGFDDYSYPILKESITKQAIAAGIDPARLKFFWD